MTKEEMTIKVAEYAKQFIGDIDPFGPLYIEGIKVYSVVKYACGHVESQEMLWPDEDNIDAIFLGEYHPEENSIYVIQKTLQEVCKECSEKLVRPEGFYPDESIQQLRFAHGLAAYTRDKSLTAIKERLSGIIKNSNQPEKWEICCAQETELIGSCGINVEGEVIYASNVDLCSKIKGEHRVFKQYNIKHLITSRNQFENQWSHKEFIVKVKTINYVWVKDWFATKEIIDDLEQFGYEVRIVKETF